MGSSIDQMAGQRLLGACGANQLGDTGASMAASGAAGYVPNIHHPEMMRSILEQIVDTGDVVGRSGWPRPHQFVGSSSAMSGKRPHQPQQRSAPEALAAYIDNLSDL